MLRKAEIAVTEVRFEDPRVGVTSFIPREDAFLIDCNCANIRSSDV